MAPLIPQELRLLEHFTSLEYYGRVRDAWEQMVEYVEDCLSRFMQNLPADYRARALPEQPDIVWGERVIPNFRATLSSLYDGYIRRTHAEYIFYAGNIRSDARGSREFWDGWMGNPPRNQLRLEVEFSRSLFRGGSCEEIPIYRQPDHWRTEAGGGWQRSS